MEVCERLALLQTSRDDFADDNMLNGRQAVHEEEHERLGGADSPDGRDYLDQMSSAQQALRDRSMQSHDMRTLDSDE